MVSDTSSVARRSLLSPRQYDVLAWIGKGCPEGVWDNFTYKTTAYALENRGLASVNKRHGTWTATLTKDGQYYLDHHAYPPTDKDSGPSATSPGSRHSSTPMMEIVPDAVVEAMQAQEGTLTIPDPSAQVRQGYITAIRQARQRDLVPDGFSLRYTGRARGDLIITLISLDSTVSSQAPDLPAVEVPTELTAPHPVIRALQPRPELIEVSETTRERALLILQGIAAECDRRGHHIGLRDDAQPTFQISIGDDVFRFLLSEEWERRDVPDPDELADVKYSWQRVRLNRKKVPSGRLALSLDAEAQRWADRKRWSLADKLPALFAYLEQEAEARRHLRHRQEEERQRQKAAWEDARQKAKDDFIRHHNSTRLDQQIANWEKAAGRRRYAQALEAYAAQLEDPEAIRQVRYWAWWARQEADSMDPLRSPEELAYRQPDNISSSDLAPFMPAGMSPWSPPGSYR